MLNRVVLVGRLTRDPELKYTPNGIAVASITLAVNRPFSNQQGNREADFINVVIWRKQAENVANYLRKGSLAGVDGRLQTRNYENNEGKKVFITEVVADSVQFLETKGSNNSGGNQGGGDYYGSPNQGGNNNNQNQGRSNQSFSDDPFASDGKPIDISDDDLPF
ncbi:single-stranded DNA-binding protein [Anaerobacillus isosaccharinicus]|uniref:Single-stranded DNA-binding protein n=1 Tax=Anaerobacillus isosaccharinicus TaxID=1532552 RepID=A0A1S2MFL4_9BACI|nr:single-stranded DNA-binding protein [Anaerobacillus isosaccharinicus]MBA5584228.1 single-stranded DNA-binding protein [Anaerobacillus isosaccharinicus]QOY37370.1 single-stranded DNA-binding protein [Anaerobacillus isosaccharinicus]